MKKQFIEASVIAAATILLCCFWSVNDLKNKKMTDSQTVIEALSSTDGSEDVISIDDQSADIKNYDSSMDLEEGIYAGPHGHVIISDEDPYTGPMDEENIYSEDSYPEPYADDKYSEPIVTGDMFRVFENQIDIYNSVALNRFLGEKHITIDEINEAVDDNDNLDDQWKEIIKEFAARIFSEYPKVDMRLFYENIKRLSVEYNSTEFLAEKDKMAYYDFDDGVIHVNENIDLDIPYNIMIIRHEIGHMISLGIFKRDSDKTIVCTTSAGDYGEYFREAIDVFISAKPYEQEYDFTDFGYSIIANELEAVILAIPDFDISVLANRDVYEIAKYLDEINPNSVSASTFINLIDRQAIDYYHYSADEENQEDFSAIYRYIANTYVNYVLNKNMSHEEIQQVSDSIREVLVRNLNYYYLYECDGIEVINKVFDEYCNENNILSGKY